jgi:hypothetical protein
MYMDHILSAPPIFYSSLLLIVFEIFMLESEGWGGGGWISFSVNTLSPPSYNRLSDVLIQY